MLYRLYKFVDRRIESVLMCIELRRPFRMYRLRFRRFNPIACPSDLLLYPGSPKPSKPSSPH